MKTSSSVLLPLLIAPLLFLPSCRKPAGEQQQNGGQAQVAQTAAPAESARPVTPGAGAAQPEPQPAQTTTPAAATAQNFAPVRSRHALAETVHTDTAANLGLICTFSSHSLLPR